MFWTKEIETKEQQNFAPANDLEHEQDTNEPNEGGGLFQLFGPKRNKNSRSTALNVEKKRQAVLLKKYLEKDGPILSPEPRWGALIIDEPLMDGLKVPDTLDFDDIPDDQDEHDERLSSLASSTTASNIQVLKETNFESEQHEESESSLSLGILKTNENDTPVQEEMEEFHDSLQHLEEEDTLNDSLKNEEVGKIEELSQPSVTSLSGSLLSPPQTLGSILAVSVEQGRPEIEKEGQQKLFVQLLGNDDDDNDDEEEEAKIEQQVVQQALLGESTHQSDHRHEAIQSILYKEQDAIVRKSLVDNSSQTNTNSFMQHDDVNEKEMPQNLPIQDTLIPEFVMNDEHERTPILEHGNEEKIDHDIVRDNGRKTVRKREERSKKASNNGRSKKKRDALRSRIKKKMKDLHTSVNVLENSVVERHSNRTLVGRIR